MRIRERLTLNRTAVGNDPTAELFIWKLNFMSMTKTANWEAICDMTDDDYFEDELWCRESEDETTTDFFDDYRIDHNGYEETSYGALDTSQIIDEDLPF